MFNNAQGMAEPRPENEKSPRDCQNLLNRCHFEPLNALIRFQHAHSCKGQAFMHIHDMPYADPEGLEKPRAREGRAGALPWFSSQKWPYIMR